jgi:hypothetical protein
VWCCPTKSVPGLRVTGISEETGIDVPERDYPQLRSLDGWVRYLVGQSSHPSDEPGSRSG